MIRGQRPGGPASSPYGRPGLSQPQRQFNSSGRPVVGGKGVARSPASRYALGGGKGRGAVGLGKGGAKRHRLVPTSIFECAGLASAGADDRQKDLEGQCSRY